MITGQKHLRVMICTQDSAKHEGSGTERVYNRRQR